MLRVRITTKNKDDWVCGFVVNFEVKDQVKMSGLGGTRVALTETLPTTTISSRYDFKDENNRVTVTKCKNDWVCDFLLNSPSWMNLRWAKHIKTEQNRETGGHLRFVEVVQHHTQPEGAKHEEEVEDGVLPSADVFDQCECAITLILYADAGSVGDKHFWLVPRDLIRQRGDVGSVGPFLTRGTVVVGIEVCGQWGGLGVWRTDHYVSTEDRCGWIVVICCGNESGIRRASH